MLCQLLLFLLLAFDQSRKRIYTFYILGFKPSAGNTSGRHSIFTFYKHISCKMGPRTPRAHSQFQKWFENDLISMRERRYEYPASESQTFSTFSARANKMAVQTSLARGWATCNACLAWSYVHYFMFNISKYYKNKKKISFWFPTFPLIAREQFMSNQSNKSRKLKTQQLIYRFIVQLQLVLEKRIDENRRRFVLVHSFHSFHIITLMIYGLSARAPFRILARIWSMPPECTLYHTQDTQRSNLGIKKNIRRLHISQPTTGTHIKTKSFASVSFSAFHPTTPTVFVILCLDSFVHVSG